MLRERADEPHVVVPAGLLLGRAVQAFGRPLRIAGVVDPLPGGGDNRVLGAHRVVVEVPAAGGEVAEGLGEQPLLALIGQVVHAQRGHHRIEGRRNRGGPVPGGHVVLDVPVPPGVGRHLLFADAPHGSGEVSEYGRAPRVRAEDRPGRGTRARAQVQEREPILLPERQEGGHEPLRRDVHALAPPGFRRPVLRDLGGLPDSGVIVVQLGHAQQATAPQAALIPQPG